MDQMDGFRFSPLSLLQNGAGLGNDCKFSQKRWIGKLLTFFLLKKRKPGKCPNYTFCSSDCCSSALLQNICRWLSTSHLLPQNGIAHSRHAVQCPQMHLFTKAVHDHMGATVSPQCTAWELFGLTHKTQNGDASGSEAEKVKRWEQ